jgi:hypothetical protein
MGYKSAWLCWQFKQRTKEAESERNKKGRSRKTHQSILEVWKMRQHPSGANSAGNMPELQREMSV